MKFRIEYDLHRHSVMFRSAQKGRDLKKAAFISAACFVASSAVTITLAAVQRRFNFVSFGITTAFFLLIGGILQRMWNSNPVRSYARFRKMLPNYGCDVGFDDESITFHAFSDNSDKTTVHDYSDVLSVQETEDCFLIRLKEGTICFAESDIPDGQTNELRMLLRQKLGERYKEKEL